MYQLLYLLGVHFNHADGTGDGQSPAGYGDRFILAFSQQRCLIRSKSK
ncbi:hypothetical protein WKK05_11515 [Nostoc sp. UHCC 0302]